MPPPNVASRNNQVVAPRRRRRSALRLVRRTCVAIASVLAAGFVVGCATPSYAKFYERYAGTCGVANEVAGPTDDASDPRLAGIKAALVRTLDEHEADLRQCYTDSLRYGETHGTVRLRIVLRADGHADPVTLVSNNTSFAPLACCVLAVVQGLRFDTFTGSNPVRIEYPFSFHTVRMPNAPANLGAAWFRSSARPEGFLVELDESSVVIGGLMMYPLAPDGIHYYTDTGEGEDPGTAAQP